MVPELDRLARSVPGARDRRLAGRRRVRLSMGGTVYDTTDPMGGMFVNILAAFPDVDRSNAAKGSRRVHEESYPVSNSVR